MMGPVWPLSSRPRPRHPSGDTAPSPPPSPRLPPPKVSLIFSLPRIQVIAPRPRPLSQAPRNVTNSLPSFTGPVTWEVFIALQPVSLSCDSAALPQAGSPHSLPPLLRSIISHQPPTLQSPSEADWNGGRLSAGHIPPFLCTPQKPWDQRRVTVAGLSVTSTCRMILILITGNNH